MADIRPATTQAPDRVTCPQRIFGRGPDHCQELFKESLEAAQQDLNQAVASGKCPSRTAAESSQSPNPVAVLEPTTTSTPGVVLDSSSGAERKLTFIDREERKVEMEAPADWFGDDGRTVSVPVPNSDTRTRYSLPEIFSAYVAATKPKTTAAVRFQQGRSCDIYQGSMYLGPTWLIGQSDRQGHGSVTVLPTKRPASSWVIGTWFSQLNREGQPHAVVVRDPDRATR